MCWAITGPRPCGAAGMQGNHLTLTVHKTGNDVTLQGISNSARIVIPDIVVCEVWCSAHL